MKPLAFVQSECKIAWLFPSLARGFYWHPLLAEMTKIFPNMGTFTGHWSGFSPIYQNTFSVEEVGKFHFLRLKSATSGYGRGIIIPSLKIIPKLLQFKPSVIMTAGFSLWTFLALTFKPIYKWKIVIIFDGVSPDIEDAISIWRTYWRKFISYFTDAFITNSQAGKKYLVQTLEAKQQKVFAHPYEIPVPCHSETTNISKSPKSPLANIHNPTFLFVGQLIERKGVFNLLEACNLLKLRGYTEWNLVIVGDGPIQKDLKSFARLKGIEGFISWEGWIKNEDLSYYYKTSDVFVFPTFEDIWGVAALEAMSSKLPILCSKLAGASELIENGSNGYSFDPNSPDELAHLMSFFIDNASLINRMGEKAGKSIESFTPEATANHLSQVIWSVIKQKPPTLSKL